MDDFLLALNRSKSFGITEFLVCGPVDETMEGHCTILQPNSNGLIEGYWFVKT